MELKIGSLIEYASAAGTRKAKIVDISIGPTAKKDFSNTWLTLLIPVQIGVRFENKVKLCADDRSLKAFKVQPCLK